MNKKIKKPSNVGIIHKINTLYHFTPTINLSSIKSLGLIPQKNKSRFGALSPELLGLSKHPKIFLLQDPESESAKDFLLEWWHPGDAPTLLKIDSSTLHIRCSKDPYYSAQESWTVDKISPSLISIFQDGFWKKIT